MSAFNPDMLAKASKKERILWLVFMGVMFFLLYGGANQMASLTAPHPSLYMSWEEKIPFIDFFIIPYMSSDLLFVVAFLLPYNRLELRVLAARVLFIITFSSIIFVLFPLQFAFDKPEIENFHFLFSALEADLPFNQLPSLHISFALVLWFSMKDRIDNIGLKYALLIWFFLIAVSTLLVYQHHFIDLPTGFIMGFIAVKFIKKDRNSVLSSFTSPRNLKMGLYYLFSAIVSMLLVFRFDGLIAWFFAWILFSLLTVSIIYAFGLNTLIAGKKSKASLWHWLVFWPYYSVSYISWRYYKRKISLMTHVKNNVYLGRYPDKDEYDLILSKEIQLIINLAVEQQCQSDHFNSKQLKQSRYPLLDQTIQSPGILHQIVLQIEENKNEGVYVHCALGLSRSVLVISAWLIYTDHSLEEIQKMLQKLRPSYVQSAYMDITMELYIKYLAGIGAPVEK